MSARKLADVESYMGPGDYTYRIEETFDKRLGQVVYELISTYRPTGVSSLVGEYNTKQQAREGMLRFRERDAEQKKGE